MLSLVPTQVGRRKQSPNYIAEDLVYRETELLATADAREGFTAFIERRPPKFTGS